MEAKYENNSEKLTEAKMTVPKRFSSCKIHNLSNEFNKPVEFILLHYIIIQINI